MAHAGGAQGGRQRQRRGCPRRFSNVPRLILGIAQAEATARHERDAPSLTMTLLQMVESTMGWAAFVLVLARRRGAAAEQAAPASTCSCCWHHLVRERPHTRTNAISRRLWTKGTKGKDQLINGRCLLKKKTACGRNSISYLIFRSEKNYIPLR